MQKILIVDDEINIRKVVREYAEFEGYEVEEAQDGMEAVEIAKKEDFDLIIMDVMMPRLDGYSACKEIKKYKKIPVIMLSARGEEYDKLFGFEIGIDDYVVKPFSVDELEARVAAHLRREKRHGSSAIVQFDNNIVIDYSSRVVFYRNAEINFTKKEFDIIEFLSQNKGIIFDRETIYEKVWGLDGSGDNSVITEHIRRIRTKFLSIGDNPYIETVWGCGYKWKK